MTQQAENQSPAEAEVPELTTSELDTVVGGLTKAGAGTLVLTASNSYRGSTTVNDGVLL